MVVWRQCRGMVTSSLGGDENVWWEGFNLRAWGKVLVTSEA